MQLQHWPSTIADRHKHQIVKDLASPPHSRPVLTGGRCRQGRVARHCLHPPCRHTMTRRSSVHLNTVKQPQQVTWSTGDAAAVGSRTLLTSELLCESVDLHAGERVLDVACGSGNAALAAARRFCRVVGVDDAPDLLERARRRAEAEGLKVTFLEGDAEDLPFPDGAFEVVLSADEAMVSSGQERTAGELLRVCGPGGRIGLVGWTPDGYVGELFAAIGRHLRPPAGLEAPMLWGGQERLRALFGPAVAITAPRRSLLWRFPSAEHQVAFLASFHGPTITALQALAPDRAGALKAELLEVARRFDVSEDDTLVLRLDYLEVIIRKPTWLERPGLGAGSWP
jgi:SAM-dependent methyltransferase